MDRSGKSEQGRDEEVERKAYYGGRVEFSRRVSWRGVALSYGTFALLGATFVYWMWHGVWLLASLSLIAAGASLTWSITVTGWYRQQRKPHYYDVMSSYPKAMMEPVRKGRKR